MLMSCGEATDTTRKRLGKVIFVCAFFLDNFFFLTLGDAHPEQNHCKKARMVKVGINGYGKEFTDDLVGCL